VDPVLASAPREPSATSADESATLPETAAVELDSEVDSEAELSLPDEPPSTRTALPSSASEWIALADSRLRRTRLTRSRCNGENHLARDCLLPRDEQAILASKKCYKCQEAGHLAR